MKFRVVERDNGTWLCDVRGRMPDGSSYRKRVVAKVSTERAAQIFAEKHWQAVLAGETEKRTKRAPLFLEFSQRWIKFHDEANRHKPSTIKTKRILLKAHLGCFNDLRLNEIGPGEIAKLKSDLAALSPKSVNNVLSVLGGLLKTAEKWGELAKAPPVELVKTEKRRMPFLSAGIYDKLVAGAATLKDKRALVTVLLAGDAGMRRGEIIALNWNCVDLDRGLIGVQASEVNSIVTSAKGRNWRVVPMTASVKAALTSLGHRTGRVLKGRTKHKGIERKTLSRLVRDAENAAGLPLTSKLHILRHTYGSLLAQAGSSLYHLKSAMGHADIQTTEDYAKLNAEALRPLAAALDAGRGARAESGQRLLEAGNIASVNGKMVEALGIEPTPDEDE